MDRTLECRLNAHLSVLWSLNLVCPVPTWLSLLWLIVLVCVGNYFTCLNLFSWKFLSSHSLNYEFISSIFCLLLCSFIFCQKAELVVWTSLMWACLQKVYFGKFKNKLRTKWTGNDNHRYPRSHPIKVWQMNKNWANFSGSLGNYPEELDRRLALPCSALGLPRRQAAPALRQLAYVHIGWFHMYRIHKAHKRWVCSHIRTKDKLTWGGGEHLFCILITF